MSETWRNLTLENDRLKGQLAAKDEALQHNEVVFQKNLAIKDAEIASLRQDFEACKAGAKLAEQVHRDYAEEKHKEIDRLKDRIAETENIAGEFSVGYMVVNGQKKTCIITKEGTQNEHL